MYTMRYIFVALLTAVVFASCGLVDHDTVRGNGNIITQDRTVSTFDEIDLSGGVLVRLKQDSVHSVKIEGDENLLELIEVEVVNEELRIKQRDNTSMSSKERVTVFVTAPAIKKFDLSGATKIIAEGQFVAVNQMDIDLSGASQIEVSVKAPVVNIQATGASTVTVTGETRNLNVDGEGASKIKAYELLAENTTVDVSGASHADVHASVSIKADASGASHINYKGGAADVKQESSGAGSVKKAD